MKIIDALKATGRVRRPGWNNDLWAEMADQPTPMIRNNRNTYSPLTMDELFAEDWEPFYEEQDCLTFQGAMEKLISGEAKLIRERTGTEMYRLRNGILYPNNDGDGCRGPSAVMVNSKLFLTKWVVIV